MKALHFIFLNSYFVSLHVVVRFILAYRDFVADNDCAMFIQIPCKFKRQRLKKRLPYVARAEDEVAH